MIRQPEALHPDKDPFQLRVLLAEARGERAAVIEAALARMGPSLETRRACSAERLLKELAGDLAVRPDVVLASDPGTLLPVEHVLALASGSQGPALPVVVIVEHADPERAMACMRLGAADQVPFSDLSRLGEALLRAAARNTAPVAPPGAAAAGAAGDSAGPLVREVLDGMPWITLELTPDGRIVALNPGGQRLFGQERGCVGVSLESLVVEADRAAVRAALCSAGRELGRPVVVRPLAAPERFLSLELVALSREGRPPRLACYGTDRTLERRAEDRSAALALRLRQGERLEALGLLASGIAHDFNNVLTDIYCVTDLAQAGASPALAARFQSIFQAVGRGACLTRQILAFSRGRPAEVRVVELGPLVASMMTMLGRIVRQDVRLVHQDAASGARVNADPTQLEQVVLNLVLNARDASPRGGEVRVETRFEEVAEVLTGRPGGAAGGPPPGSYVVLRVADQGAGIPDSLRPHLFEPFYSTKEGERGTGLGLHTVNEVVKRHAGSIVVTTELGRGTAFDIYLPRLGESPASDEPPAVLSRAADQPEATDGPEPPLASDSGASGRDDAKPTIAVPAGWILVRARALGI